MRRLECVSGSSSKFWQAEAQGADLVISWGRIGTAGQTQTKSFPTPSAAHAELTKLVDQKTKKGYTEVDGAPSAPEPTTPTPPQPPAASASNPDIADVPPWLADGDPVDLDEEFIAAAAPTRAHPPRHLPEPDWAGIIDAAKANGELFDLDATQSDLRDPLASLWSQQPGSYTPTQCHILLAMQRTRHWSTEGASFMRAIVADAGVVEAARLLIGSLSHTVIVDYDNQRRRRYSLPYYYEPRPPASTPLFEDVELLGQLACLASEKEYAELVEVVRAAGPQLKPVYRAAFALALPDTPELSHELITEFADAGHNWVSWLQATATDPELIERARRVKTESYSAKFADTAKFVNALVVNRGSAAASVLTPHAGHPTAGAALARIGLPEAIRALAGVASASKENMQRLRHAVDRWPAAAVAGLAQTLGDGGRSAAAARVMLAGVAASKPDLVAAVRPWLTGAAGAVLDDVAGQLAADFDEAALDELPRVLADPPWLRPKRDRPLVDRLEPLASAPVATWYDGERDEWAKSGSYLADDPIATAQELAESMCATRYWDAAEVPDSLQQDLAAALASGDVAASVAAFQAWAQAYKAASRYGSSAQVNPNLLCNRAEAVLDAISPGFGLRLWNALAGGYDSHYRAVIYVLARHGVDGVPGLVGLVRRRPNEYLGAARVFGAVELAPLVARAYRKLKTLRESAIDWLRAHPEHAAGGLIPAAIGAPGETRDNAEAALRFLAIDGSRELILATAAKYDREEVTAAVVAMLDEDPTELYPTKRPKLPTFWNPTAWRRPMLTTGKAIPLTAVDHFGTMLAFPTADGIYAGVTQVTASCTRDSLAAFGWDLFTAWLNAAAPTKESWAMTSLGLLGNDDTARQLTPLLRAWPGESQHKRAVTGLDVLEGIGSDVALMMLNGVAGKVKFKALQDRAREKIDQIALNRGLTTAELEDRLAPDLGLDADGTLLLDFGPRRFRVGFDEALKPFVRDADGARLKELPKARRDDDTELAAAAATRWKTLKKGARTVAGQQLLRLELAMCTRRHWDTEVFEQFLAGHPLVRHLVRRLVWAVYTETDTIQRCFRVAEDGQYTDADDEPVTLPTGALIRLPHPLELSSDDRTAFGQLFTDYELLQPFPQLDRDTYRLTDAERAATELTRWADLTVPIGKILGLTNRGWERGEPEDAGVVMEMVKPLAGGSALVAELSDGLSISTGTIDAFAAEQQIIRVFVGGPGRWGTDRPQHTFGGLDDITASELIRDLEALRS
ncbi:hypothetical protein BKN37_15225 [Mycobacterium talmoniae]|uniref:WGR domain-containing protein n=1 Tax=Mycobacterium talmoniae TaxID=1858794 RepID=A0A1S1NCQ7_9MYCO|nr:hypothetical protein BKN37_15225 [Mycobacterium talmoniae]